MTDSKPVGVALLGGGIFARQSHVPALNTLVSNGLASLKAVYSRTKQSAEQTKELLNKKESVDVYFGDDLDKLLARADIDAVVVCLPIDMLPKIVLTAFAAGKHVLSEKPVSPTVKSGEELVAEYQKLYESKLVWGVAENYFYEPAFIKAKEIISSGIIGPARVLNATLLTGMGPDSPYYHTQWRLTPDYQGGYLLDAGVHTVAAMRLILGDIAKISGQSSQFRPDLPPVDSMACSFEFQSGTLGVLTMSFACTKLASPFTEHAPPLFTLVGDKGVLRVNRDKVEVITSKDGTTCVDTPALARDVHTAIVAEFQTFLEAVKSGSRDKLYSPREALKDVAFIESALRKDQ